ncbi:MAG: hypothetical protein JWO86_4853 [Myxococcaceae bacterium]|jgi:hypothetical protein|nr:hypothetical protein [Myxococcaceae bacterium]MEA2753667.1 hypothetical protein [Myxococcales bacterium]
MTFRDGRLSIVGGVGGLTVLVAISMACVGSDPATVANETDGAATGGATDSGEDAVDGNVAVESGSSDGSDAAPPPCQLAMPFGAPVPFDAVNTNADESDLRFSDDGALATFTRGSFTSNVVDIFVATKASGFTDATSLNGANTPGGCCNDSFASISADGFEVIFESNDQPPSLPGGPRVWRASRTSTSLDFTGRAAIAALTSINGYYPILAHDGASIYFVDLTMKQIQQSKRVSGAAFAAPSLVLADARYPALSGDELTIYYTPTDQSSVRKATRASKTASWIPGDAVPELAGFTPSWLSADGCTIALTGPQPANGKTGGNVWTASKPK